MTTIRRLCISNVYGHGFDEGERARLEALGFRLRSETSRFSGAQLLSFLDFARGPALELIEVEDEQQYLGFVPPGMEPYCPGISLVACEGSSVAPADILREFADLDPHVRHVGYDGSDDPAAPGWNYVNFATPIVPGIFTYYTALDAPRPAKPHLATHPNGVSEVAGLVFDLSMSRLRRLAELAGATAGDESFCIDAVEVSTTTAAPEVASVHETPFPLKAVVLEAPDLDALAHAEETVEISFGSAPAVLIETTPLSWDLIIRPEKTS